MDRLQRLIGSWISSCDQHGGVPTISIVSARLTPAMRADVSRAHVICCLDQSLRVRALAEDSLPIRRSRSFRPIRSAISSPCAADRELLDTDAREAMIGRASEAHAATACIVRGGWRGPLIPRVPTSENFLKFLKCRDAFPTSR